MSAFLRDFNRLREKTVGVMKMNGFSSKSLLRVGYSNSGFFRRNT